MARTSKGQSGRQRVFFDKDVYAATADRLNFVFDNYDNIIVSFSGGKDSTAVLNTTLEVAQQRGHTDPIDVVFFDEEAISFETEHYMRRVIDHYGDRINVHWLCVPVRHRNAASMDGGYWYPWAPELAPTLPTGEPNPDDKWVRPLPPEAITIDHPSISSWYTDPANPEDRLPLSAFLAHWIANRGYRGRVAQLLGIRAQESLVRRRAVMNARPENYIIPVSSESDKVYPVYDWTANDVWAAPNRFGWDYNESYDMMQMAGLSVNQQRCGPPFGDEPLGMLWMWSVCFPDIWERLCARVPGAATAARYSRSELYSYGSVPEKPEGESWQTFIRRQIEREEDPGIRAHKAAVVKKTIEKHRRSTLDPLLFAAHPTTGVGWRILTKMAVRGDMKGRTSASLVFDDPNGAYTKELAQWMTANPRDYRALEQRWQRERRTEHKMKPRAVADYDHFHAKAKEYAATELPRVAAQLEGTRDDVLDAHADADESPASETERSGVHP